MNEAYIILQVIVIDYTVYRNAEKGHKCKERKKAKQEM